MQIKEPFTRLQPVLAEFAQTNDLQSICKFTGANILTVRRWVADKNPAKGENEIRLWHFLLAAGYEFSELRVDAFNFYLSELLAYSVIDIEKVMEVCGVRNAQTALQIMRGQPPMHPAASLTELHELYDEQLQEAKRTLQAELRVFDDSHLSPLPEASAEELAEAPAFDVLVPVLAAMVRGVTPLAQQALESWTPAQRSRLRELAGDELFQLANDMHNLSQILGALNSERARAHHNPEGK